MHIAIKRTLHWMGAILCIAAIAFFVEKIRNSGLSAPPGGFRAIAPALLGAVAVYCAAVTLLALMWSILILGRVKWIIVSSYLVAQFGKYIPGNVFQFVGRHALGRQLGVSHSELARAAVYEIIYLIAAASIVTGVLAVHVPAGQEWLRPTALFGGLGVLLTIFMIPRIGIRHRLVLRLSPLRHAVLAGGYTMFFAIFGLLYWVCLRMFGMNISVSEPVGAASLGWIFGFVVPGAPAGAGLRETIMSLVSTSTKDSAALILGAIMIFRVITMGGDLLAFLLGFGLRHLVQDKPQEFAQDR